MSSQQRDDVFKSQFFNLFYSFVSRISSVVAIPSRNCFCRHDLTSVKTNDMFSHAAEVLDVVVDRMTTASVHAARASAPRNSQQQQQATFHGDNTTVSGDVSHHYRHWQQAPISSVANLEESVTEKSRRVPYTGTPMGGLHSHQLSENRRATITAGAVRDDIRRELMSSRSVLASPGSSQTDILNRLKKAKTAFEFMHNNDVTNSSTTT
jgi:hypothetical protein